MRSDTVLRSGDIGKILQLHLSGIKATIEKIAISEYGVYVLSNFQGLYWIPHCDINKSTHYKLIEIAQEIKDIFSGKIASAIDQKGGFYFLLPNGLDPCPLLKGVTKASLHRNHYLAVLGINLPEKPKLESSGIPSLFEIAEERVTEILV